MVTIFVKLRRYHGRLKNIYSDTSLYQEIKKISNNLNLLLKQQEKKKEKFKVSRRQEIVMIRAEINEDKENNRKDQ